MSRKNLILIIVLILLSAIAYIYQGPLKKWQIKNSQVSNFLSEIDVNKVNKMEIVKDKETTNLSLNAGRWKIEGTKDFYVSAETADKMLQTLKKLSDVQLELVSQNKDRKKDFFTDEETGVKLKLKQDDDELVSLIIGKLANDYASTYISRADMDATYMAKVDAYSVFYNNNWYDKTIFAGDKTKVNKVRFQYPREEFLVEKKEEEWSIVGRNIKLNKDKIIEIVNLMSNLAATEIPEQKFVGTGLEKNLAIIQVTGENVDNTLIIGNSADKDLVYVKKSDSDNIYLIKKTERDKLVKQIKDLQ